MDTITRAAAGALLGLSLVAGACGGETTGTVSDAVGACDPGCGEHGACQDGACACAAGYAGVSCGVCASGFTGFPDCVADPCVPDPCHGNGSCAGGVCACEDGYVGAACDACELGYAGYPACAKDPCQPDPCGGHGACRDGVCTCDPGYVGAGCDGCDAGWVGYPDCETLCESLACAGATPRCDEDNARCVECLDGGDCPASLPRCVDGACAACVDSADPVPPGTCEGVCGLVPPICEDGRWQCVAPGYEGKVERSCDGFDNDCDGEVDEGVCTACTPPLDAISGALHAIWDIDFDYACNTYLTTMISGPDFTKVVAADGGAVATYYGNANQNMGFGLVDPDPTKARVVVTYSCCPGCGCQAANGLTLLYTCDDDVDPDCGCAGQANCPGFLNVPFIKTGQLDTNVTYGPGRVSTPTGLAVGPGDTYFVGNFRPSTCTNAAGCVACDPDHPDAWCTTDGAACCDSGTLGRLVQFTLPEVDAPPTWRLAHVFEGEAILGLASGRDGSVLVGTNAGNLYRWDPIARVATLWQTWPGTVFSITQDRRNGHWYVETLAPETLHRLWPDGTERPLPPALPEHPTGQATLQYGPDGALYRLQGKVSSAATLERTPLPLWSAVGGPCSDVVLCEAPAECQGQVCVAPTP
ncbi:MAG: hypothetical protein CVU56_24940 [Deltaproteobacteria bacterium HGW-Deltaproteobacteria-14]|jgi:hypothetical protein|nr:MAG: hypothetical protein CVU56_24940 [Deltaproteobacteria bacterium HGW-Deltaproteobacteria-14]